jgi:nitric oxide reductase activation protein
VRLAPAPSVVTWLQRFDTNPNAEGPRALIAGLYGHAGREEVCQGLRLLAPHLLARPEGTKLLIYLHDGQPNDAARIPATLAEVRAQGILVLGLYIGPQQDLDRMQALFGTEFTIGTEHLSRLPQLLGRILARYRIGR